METASWTWRMSPVDQRWRDLAAEAVRFLDVEAIQVETQGGSASHPPAIGWPRVAGATLTRPVWCHGAVGIGRFLLRASEADIPGAARLARGAASSALGAEAGFAGQCHGAAGVIELLLDLYQADGTPGYLQAARRLESAAEVYSFSEGDELHWVGEIPGRAAFEYAVGSSGLLPCLLRLADPERRPYLLSRRGFRWRRELPEPRDRRPPGRPGRAASGDTALPPAPAPPVKVAPLGGFGHPESHGRLGRHSEWPTS